jgi:ATP-dependent DNA helicase PIF1
MDQKTALDVLKLGYNVYLTGPAGSGKTYLLNQYIKYLKDKGVEVGITASTGIAATHMNGITIHSWSGMGIKKILGDKEFRSIGRNGIKRKRFRETGVLIIDEISMLHAYQLDNLDAILKKFLDPFQSFGGLQIVLCGDLFQLPPVEKSLNRAQMIYESDIWQKMNLKIVYLDGNRRQKDKEMIKVLNDIRSQNVSEKTEEILFSRLDKDIKGKFKSTKIYTHNKDVDNINNEELVKIKKNPLAYQMVSEGVQMFCDLLKQGCLSPERLVVKKGAIVMFVKNNFEVGYVNGTTGVITGFDSESKFPIVKIRSGKHILAEPVKWEYEEGGEIKAWIKQIPLRLAWAITVHKSQGMTLDSVEADLSKSFECGMGYVALSRVKELSGLKLLGINNKAFEVNPDVAEFDKKLIELSKETEKEFLEINLMKKVLKQMHFIRLAKKKKDE